MWTLGLTKTTGILNPNRVQKQRFTGGIFNDQVVQSKSEFKAMDMDEKLVTLFKRLNCTNSNTDNLSVRMTSMEGNMQNLSTEHAKFYKRIRTLEYKSIDAEARSRRNNLVFRGICPKIVLPL